VQQQYHTDPIPTDHRLEMSWMIGELRELQPHGTISVEKYFIDLLDVIVCAVARG
jgi:hypothetical protein